MKTNSREVILDHLKLVPVTLYFIKVHGKIKLTQIEKYAKPSMVQGKIKYLNKEKTKEGNGCIAIIHNIKKPCSEFINKKLAYALMAKRQSHVVPWYERNMI